MAPWSLGTTQSIVLSSKCDVSRCSVGCYLTQVDITPITPAPIELYLSLSYLLEDFLFQVLGQA